MSKVLTYPVLLVISLLAIQPLQGQPRATQADQRGTKDSPFVVDTQGHQDNPEETAQRKKDKDEKDFTDRWTFRATVANAICTFILMVVGAIGICFARRTLRTIEAQTKATQSSVEALINSERAWIQIDIDQSIDLIEYDTNTVDPFNRFRFTMTNAGKTVARPKKIQATVFCSPDEGTELPDSPVYWPQNDYPPEKCGVLAPMGKGVVVPLDIRKPFNADLIDRMQRGVSIFYIFGHIEYYDFSKEVRVLNFCYRYTSEGERFGQDVVTRWKLYGLYNSHT